MSEDARNAVASAYTLVRPARGRPAVDDDEAVARLSGMSGGRSALQEAARYLGRSADRGYPTTRMLRLLQAAAGQPVAARTAQEAAVEARQRQLSEQPYAVTFHHLAEQVPALRGLEHLARHDPKRFLRGLPVVARVIGGPTRAGRQLRITIGMRRAVQRFVGPTAGLSDPVLSSPAAVSSVERHLWRVAGIDPGSWGPARERRAAQRRSPGPS